MSTSGPSAPSSVRPATPADRGAVAELLKAAELPLAGIPNALEHFLVAESNGTVVGAIGLERYGTAALLRSAVVHPAERGTGVGETLVHALLAHARTLGVADVGLLTTTAEHWFPRFGFERTERNALPPSLFESEEFKGACPATAVSMRLRISAAK
jgi:amino-acid N-acetyltransferase